ncbi:solute carrier family 23 member 1-like isoform X2 [Macrobrachium nipponense]|uniref:solute carrier family 23 member 1-like isoform X2 n=1 Tax=Macrobrachium nipponense TaxID=159736 RepID=UPI0030C85D50
MKIEKQHILHVGEETEKLLEGTVEWNLDTSQILKVKLGIERQRARTSHKRRKLCSKCSGSEEQPPDENGAMLTPEEQAQQLQSTTAKEPPRKKAASDFLYSVEDNPPWYACIIYSLQHYLSMVAGTISIPIILSSYLCLDEDNPAKGHLVSTIIFMSGLITLLQATFGVRLPIIQGGNFVYVIPLIALLTTNYESCSALPLANMTRDEREEIWLVRMRETQGAIALSALVQIFVGFTGLIGLLLAWITPLTIIPTVALVGLSLADVASSQGSGHWGIFFLTLVLSIIFSQHMKEITVSVPVYKRRKGFSFYHCQPFKTLPLLLSVIISWSLCALLSAFNLFPEGSPARTERTYAMVREAPWVSFPYPGQWGVPTASVAGVIGMLAAVFSSIVESIGDYYACARVVGAPMPPTHAINRGIGVEGIGCMLAGLWGTTSGTTSYSGNIGILGITKVGSRRVIQYSAVIMMICGVFGKIGAFFVTVPEPIIAAVFTIKFSMITAVGLSSAQFIDLSSSRNLFVLGFSIFFGLSFPKWAMENPSFMQTGYSLLDQTVSVLLQTSMFVGGSIGLILDNTIPGTDEERGLVQWEKQLNLGGGPTSAESTSCYDLPFGMGAVKKLTFARYLPFLPAFQGFSRKSTTSEPMC